MKYLCCNYLKVSEEHNKVIMDEDLLKNVQV